MRKLALLTTILSIFLFVTPTSAQSPTEEPQDSSVAEKLDEQINELKEKIASRVSELDLVEKRGMIGVVDEVKSNQITITSIAGETRFIDVDEITKFASGNSTGTFGISDLKKGTRISILGNYNKQSKRVLARFINTHTVPTRYSGTITEVDQQNYQVTINTIEQKEAVIDIETSSDIYAYTKEAGLVRYGFSKLEVGDRISVVGTPDAQDATLLSADRLIDFINIPGAVETIEATQQPAQVTVTLAPTSANRQPIQPAQ